MSRVTRGSFIADMSNGGGIDVGADALSPATTEALARAGISREALADIAGDDHHISGHDELSRLFDLLDRVDHDGSYNSIATTTRTAEGRAVTTLSGDAMEVLKGEIERARVNRNAPPPAATAPVANHQQALSRLEAAGLTDIHLAEGTPYYNQGDAPWADYPYPKSSPEPGAVRTLKEAGCAPCALAMADATLRGSDTKPTDVADFAVDGGFSGKAKHAGSDTIGLAKQWAATHDLTFTQSRSSSPAGNVDAIRKGLDAGGVALISVGTDENTGRGHFTAGHHVMLVNGYARDSQGEEWFFVVNPGRHNQEKSPTLKTDATVKQDRSLNNGAGALRISRAQLELELKGAGILERRT